MAAALDSRAVERFWRFVPERPQDPDACWLWFGAMNGRDKLVPSFRLGHSQKTAARVAWMIEHGRVPRGYVRRRCGNPRCVRASHLRIGRVQVEWKGRDGPWGEANGNSVLSDEQVYDVRILYERGGTQQQLADYFGVTQAAVSLIVRGKSRAAAGGPISELGAIAA